MSSLNPGEVRTIGIGALLVGVLYAISVPIGSLASAPSADASAAAVLGFFTAHRDGILATVVMNGIAWCALMPAVFVGLRRVIGAEGREAMNVAVMGAAVESALIGVILVFVALAAYSAPGLSARTAKLLSDGYLMATVASSWPTLACVLGLVVAVRRSRALPAIVVVLGLLVAVAHAFAALAVARDGAFSASGVALLAAPLFALWMAVIGVALLREPARVVIAQPAAA
ncbi:MAG: hypothetical protein ACXVHB_28195 [Solirubrobacteraceae bacterium]